MTTTPSGLLNFPSARCTTKYTNATAVFSPPGEADELPGLDLDDPALRGLGVIVATVAEAEAVVYDIVTKVDRGDIASDNYAFVLAHETVLDWTGLRDLGALDEELDKHLISLAPLFEQTQAQTNKLAAVYESLVRRVRLRAPTAEPGERGGCWLWLMDNTAELTRALVAKEMAFVHNEGKYLVRLPSWSDGHSLAQRQVLAKQIAERLLERFEMRATYFAVRNSDDPDVLPSYHPTTAICWTTNTSTIGTGHSRRRDFRRIILWR